MNKAPALEFENVTKTFLSGRAVVQNLSFSVKPGEFFSILGPSGCGKTTCLRLISGLERPTKGVIRMNQKVVNEIHPHQRNVHTVFQKYALFPHLNVFENVAFPLRIKKKPLPEIRSRVEQMLKLVELNDHAKRPIHQLSGGEQQRVALVRALINEPSLLLLDEPLAALDLKLREQMQQELSALQKQLGTTFIFVTHDQQEALMLSDRVAIMNGGKLEQVGTPTEIYEQPASAFVARFVGTTNIFNGIAIGASSNTLSINTRLGALYAKCNEPQASFAPHNPIGFIVRPEKIRVRVTAPPTASAASDAAPVNVLRGTLVERTYFGPTTQIKLQVDRDAPALIALVANQTATKMPALKMGERYYAVWDASDSVLIPQSEPQACEAK